VSRAYRHDLNGSDLAPGSVQLEIDRVSLHFGGVQALRDVAVEVRQGEIHAIIGPNGAGKTSLLNCISGVYRPQRGRSSCTTGRRRPHELTRLREHRIARLGVARAFQNIELFKHISVLDNLMLGPPRPHAPLGVALRAVLRPGPSAGDRPPRARRGGHRLPRDPGGPQRPRRVAAYGLQKRVEVGRALCLQPAVLLLDEPMAGMNAEEKEDMARFVLDVNDLAGVTVVLIEHDMEVVMDISDRVTVLDFGEASPRAVRRRSRPTREVIEAYLGEELV
jgi:branched-chain amino acid transport system ATP-binding protein